MESNNKIFKNLVSVLKNENVQKYGGEGIWDLIQTLFTGDAFSGISAGKNIKELIFHIPTANFWGKMQRFLLGTYRNFEEQVKMAEKFNSDNRKYEEFVYMMIETVDKMDSMAKINYFSNLTRMYLLNIVDENLFYKLRQILLTCNHIELSFVAQNDIESKLEYDIMIFSLKSIGLAEQVNTSDKTYYKLTALAGALKTYALSDDDVSKPPISYLELSAPQDMVPAKSEDIENIVNGFLNLEETNETTI